MNEILITIFLTVILLVIGAIFIKKWIKIAWRNYLVGKNMQSYKKQFIAEAGGFIPALTYLFTIFLYVFIKTFIWKSATNMTEIFVLAITVLLACFIGFSDDILGWKKGIKGWHRVILTIPVAIPLAVINAGQSIMHVPFIGAVDFGIIYPLLLIPLALVGTTNGFNLLAGYNGLEAGLGIIIFTTFAVIFYITNQPWLILLAFLALISLIPFYMFNKYPAKVFPGDSGTFFIGSLIGCFAILGNIEKSVLIIFLPFVAEGILKAFSNFKAENFGIPNPDDSLEMPYKKIYSLTHLSLWLLKRIKPSHKVYEKDVVYLLYGLQIILGIIAALLSLNII